MLDTDGKVIHPVTGTPQGGIVSPILANVYLHYALDLWFKKVAQKRCRGEACLIRYADDFVCAFEYRGEAEAFYQALGERLGKFGLELAGDKTRIIAFERHQSQTSFEFLGFEFRWGVDRSGKPYLKRRTARNKLRNALAQFTQWCRENRNLRLSQLFEQVRLKLRGHYNYYGVSGNYDGLKEFYGHVVKLLWKWLNRRSQRCSFNWHGFQELMTHFQLPRPRITKRIRTSVVASLV